MEYISAKEMAARWGVSERRVRAYCLEGKIQGSQLMGRQWLIPIDTQKPVDGRTKQAREMQLNSANYHFPFLIHTPYFIARESLDDDYLSLLRAQIHYMNGDYEASIQECKNLEKSPQSTPILAGLHTTIALSSMLGGHPEEFERSYAQLERIIEAEAFHQEDYRLLRAAIMLYTGWQVDAIKEINAMDLGIEALDFHSMMLAEAASFAVAPLQDSHLSLFEVICQKAEASGHYPDATCLHASLAAIYKNRNDEKKMRHHIAGACELTIANNCWGYLTKTFFHCSAATYEYMRKHHPEKAELIQTATENMMSSRSSVSQTRDTAFYLGEITLYDYALLHALSVDSPDEALLPMLGITPEELDERIKALCQKLNLKDRDELIAFTRQHFEALGTIL